LRVAFAVLRANAIKNGGERIPGGSRVDLSTVLAEENKDFLEALIKGLQWG
jgi:hypothetical protein